MREDMIKIICTCVCNSERNENILKKSLRTIKLGIKVCTMTEGPCL